MVRNALIQPNHPWVDLEENIKKAGVAGTLSLPRGRGGD